MYTRYVHGLKSIEDAMGCGASKMWSIMYTRYVYGLRSIEDAEHNVHKI
jgi:hypothetical protein